MAATVGAVLALIGIAGVGAGLLLTRTRPAVEPAQDYLLSLGEIDEGDDFDRILAEPFVQRVLRPIAGSVTGLVGGALPRNYRHELGTQLLRAGLAGRFRVEEVLTLQVLAGAAGLAVATVLAVFDVVGAGLGIALLFVLPAAGLQLPRTWLRRRVEERADALRRDLPDTIDLLAISVEAGMGFEGAIAVVCDNFDSPLSDELARTLREMELGLPRRDALANLKRRTEVPELSNFVLTLTQADALGMPIGRVLKTSAAEQRVRRQQWAREKAAKLPVKILFPLVLFIFPPIFVIVMGPAASDIGGAFG